MSENENKEQEKVETKNKPKGHKKTIAIVCIIIIVLIVAVVGGYFAYEYIELKQPIEQEWADTYYQYIKGSDEGETENNKIQNHSKISFIEVEKVEDPVMLVDYEKEGKDYYLRIIIDKPGGIDLNDCEKVNNEINDILDEADYIKEQYFLEVSSTGLEKLLRKDSHLQENIGNEVQVSLYKPIEILEKKQKEFIGTIINFNDNEINFKIDNKEVTIDRKSISQIKTIFDWDSLKIEEE